MKKTQISKEQFEVLSAKRLAGEITVTYWDKDINREVLIKDTNAAPHPDLPTAFNKMKEHMIKIYEYNGHEDNIQITGFKLKKGTDDDVKSFSITAKMKFSNGKVGAINSPLLFPVKDGVPQHYGFEDGVQECIEGCIDELFEFFFKGKQSQLEIPMDDEDTEE